MDEDRFGGKKEGNREFISFQFSFFASVFIIARRLWCLNHQTWRTICHFPLNDSWDIYLYCCRVSGSNICRSAEDNLSFDIFARLSMRASWSQSWPFGVVGRGEQRGSCSLAPVTCWCANSCKGRGMRITFWIWEFMKMLKAQGCQMELYMSLSSGHRHWAFSGRSTSVSTEREESVCSMWTVERAVQIKKSSL